MALRIDAFTSRPSLVVERFSWKNSSAEHVRVVDTTSGISGFGDDANFSVAQSKALFEMFERRVFNQVTPPGWTSSGWAAHSCQRTAQINSQLELIERDAVLCSWLFKIPPEKVGADYFAPYKSKFSILSFGRYKNHSVLGVVIMRSSSQRMLLTCIADNLSDGILKLKAESERADVILRKKCSLPGLIRLHHEAFNSLTDAELSWLQAGGEGVEIPTNPRFETQLYELPLWNGQKAWVAQSSSVDLQALYFGMAQLKNLNRPRLHQLRGHGGKLNRILHPIL